MAPLTSVAELFAKALHIDIPNMIQELDTIQNQSNESVEKLSPPKPKLPQVIHKRSGVLDFDSETMKGKIKSNN